MEKSPRAGPVRNRPFIGVFFRCCRVYQRIYRNPEGDSYAGFCPHCLRQVKVRVGAEGTQDRIFEAE
jgi:hypothetical protein